MSCRFETLDAQSCRTNGRLHVVCRGRLLCRVPRQQPQQKVHPLTRASRDFEPFPEIYPLPQSLIGTLWKNGNGASSQRHLQASFMAEPATSTEKVLLLKKAASNDQFFI